MQLPKGRDFEALYAQPSTNFDRSTKLDLTTEPPLLGSCCYTQTCLNHLLFKAQLYQRVVTLLIEAQSSVLYQR
jgi:hypothetical protein